MTYYCNMIDFKQNKHYYFTVRSYEEWCIGYWYGFDKEDADIKYVRFRADRDKNYDFILLYQYLVDRELLNKQELSLLKYPDGLLLELFSFDDLIISGIVLNILNLKEVEEYFVIDFSGTIVRDINKLNIILNNRENRSKSIINRDLFIESIKRLEI